MNYIKCSSNQVIKNGKEPYNQKQKYKSKLCNKTFYDSYSKYKKMTDEYRKQMIKLYTEGMSIRVIVRTLGFSYQTIFQHIKKNGKTAPQSLL